MNNNTLLKEIEQKANIQDIENISSEETQKIVKLLEERKIEEKHIKALSKASPKFIDSVVEIVSLLPRLAEKAVDINKQAIHRINHINHTTSILSELAGSVQSDEARVEIAKLVVQVANEYNEIVKEMNVNNNNFLQNTFAFIGSSIVAVILIIFKRDEA